jgi:hypothetical protein
MIQVLIRSFRSSSYFLRGDLVLIYDQDKDPLGAGKFKPVWFRLFIVKEVLKKGTYRLVDFEGNSLEEPRNGLYLKKYYSYIGH